MGLLFSKYNIDNSTHGGGHTSVDITEKKAPTDASVRLLREMEKAALDSVLSVFKIEDNGLNGMLVERTVGAYGTVLHLLFTLNGKKCYAEVKNYDSALVRDATYAAELIREHMAEAIVNTLIANFTHTIAEGIK